jgi:hypothetical protein
MKLYHIAFGICLFIFIQSCTRVETFADLFEGMEISVVGAEDLLADSVSSAKVLVTFEKNLVDSQVITLSTSHGVLFQTPFDPNQTGASELNFAPFDDQAEALLVAKTLEPSNEVFVSVTINGFTKYQEIAYGDALPQSMQLSAENQELAVGETPDIVGSLFRDEGFCSNGIRFEVRDSLEFADTSQMELITVIPDFVFSKNNQVKVPIEILQHSPESRLRVIVSTTGENGALIEESILLWFQ